MLKRRETRVIVLAAAFVTASLIHFILKPARIATDQSICTSKEASFGIFYGQTHSSLEPLDTMNVQGSSAWPIVNPVFSAAGMKTYDGVDAPFLYLHQDKLYMFYEATSCMRGRRGIDAAESVDDGITWKNLGTVVTMSRSRGTLRRPSIFSYNDELFMVTDGSSGVQLHKCIQFPTDWQHNATLTNDPLRGVSITKATIGNLGDQVWYMMGSIKNSYTSKTSIVLSEEDDVLALHIASSPLGPWRRYSYLAIAAASPAGGLVGTIPGVTLRLGRQCVRGQCSDVVSQTIEISTETVNFTDGAKVVRNFLSERVWKQPGGWDGNGRSAASLVSLPSGKVAAVVVGHCVETPMQPWYAPYAYKIQYVLQITAGSMIFVFVSVFILRVRIVLSLLSCGWHKRSQASRHVSSPTTSRHYSSSPSSSDGIQRRISHDAHLSKTVYSPRRGELSYATHLKNRAAGQPSSSGTCNTRCRTMSAFEAALEVTELEQNHQHNDIMSSTTSSPSPLAPPLLPKFIIQFINALLYHSFQTLHRRALRLTYPYMITTFLFCIFIVSLAHTCTQIIGVMNPFWSPAHPVPVSGQYSRFTLMVMSYEKRRSLLSTYVEYYQHCPSVGEILIVWNTKNEERINSTSPILPPPNARKDFGWALVPVRVRVESNNSLGNRYKPDGQIRFRAVLSLDDDLRIPCRDIEEAFAYWRANPDALVGFFPRLVEFSSTPRYHPEPQSIEKGWYNMILSGAAFIDSRHAFAQYWSDAVAPARAIVDSVQNCDDILMNFVVANASHSKFGSDERRNATVIFIAPSRRFDVSWRSGVGLSHSVKHFLSDAEFCLEEFSTVFRGWPLKSEQFEWTRRKKPRCEVRHNRLGTSWAPSAENALDCHY